MKVNITGLLRGALSAIDPTMDEGAYAFAVEELIDHIDAVRRGEHTLEEFAAFYCIDAAYARAPAQIERKDAK